ncbi:hypothetical protein RJT34_19747 [Clitoria ternatea]|uniref:C2H2-type domain-containing protein n=1 Tax=Clitoria ternatea TaxID=43366 RepID=A0AAN9IRN6_CLITE
MQDQEDHVLCNNKDYMQVMKGKRTKRQRLPSPLTLTMSTTCSSSPAPDNNNSSGFDLPITTTSSNELSNRTEEEDHDMANCLILLAQGHHHHHFAPKASQKPPPINHHSNKAGLYLYECKTCNRCFPSFQALGGHRASHKKPKPNVREEKQGGAFTTTFVNDQVDHDHDYYYDDATCTTLTLQLSTNNNKALHNNNSTMIRTTATTSKSKVHECSICGAEFTSGQALGGHMRRHRNFLSAPTTTVSMSGGDHGSHEIQQVKKHKDCLKLDLNLPAAPDDDHRESKLFPFQSKENVIALAATSLVDCHY